MKRKYIIMSICVIVVFFMLVISINTVKKHNDKKSSTTTTAPIVNPYEVVSDEVGEEDNVGEEGKEYDPAKMVVNADELVGYKKAIDEENNFDISNVNVDKKSKLTNITGTIKNKGRNTKVVIKAEFYDKGNVLGSTSIAIEEIKENESKDFIIKAMNDIVSDDYKVTVDYVGE